MYGIHQGKTSQHSIRVGDDAWAKAVSRAKNDGRTPSTIIAMFVMAYGEGQIDLPTLEFAQFENR